MNMKSCYIISMSSTIKSPFEINDINELSKYFEKIEIYTLKKNDINTLPNNFKKNIEIKNIKNTPLKFISKIIFNYNFYKNLFLIIFSKDLIIEKLKQCYFIPRSMLIANEINLNQPTNVHLFWGHYPSLVIINLKENLKTKISIFIGAYDLRKKLSITNLAIQRSHYLITHVKKNTNLIKKYFTIGKKKINIIYRGLKVNELNRKEIIKFQKLRKKYSFCSIGMLEKHKNHEQVIDIFSKIKKKFPEATLKILGDGSLRKYLEKKVEILKLNKSITFRGWVSRKEIIKTLCQSQYCMHFSKVEAIPNNIKEAMFYGCIPISSNTHGIDELIDHKKNGFIAKSVSFNYVLKVINSTLNKKYSDMIINNAKNRIKNKYNISKNIKSFVNVIKI